MAEAEAELRSYPGKAAALAIGKAMLAAGGIVFRGAGVVAGLCRRRDPSQGWLRVNGSGIDDGSGASGFWIHGFLFLWADFLREGGYTPGQQCKSMKGKELREEQQGKLLKTKGVNLQGWGGASAAEACGKDAEN
jgi:hypothetical protein